jgi:hypothetical protein
MRDCTPGVIVLGLSSVNVNRCRGPALVVAVGVADALLDADGVADALALGLAEAPEPGAEPPVPTVMLSFCVASGPVPLLARIVNENVPVEPGTPDSVAVLLPLSCSVMPGGGLPELIEMTAVGVEDTVTVRL